MALGPSDPTWVKLYEALSALATACGGSFAFVLDAGNGLWCIGIPGRRPTASTREQDRAADRFYAAELVSRAHAMRRGVRVELTKSEGEDRYGALSFASLYCLVVWFDGAFDPFTARTRMREALPAIESLTLSLPPSGGPGAGEGVGRQRA